MNIESHRQFCLEALAYFEKNAHTEETIDLRKGMRSVISFLSGMSDFQPISYKQRKYEVCLNNWYSLPFQQLKDAEKYASHLQSNGHKAVVREAV